MIKKLPWLILECSAIIGAVLFLYSFDGVMQFWDEATDIIPVVSEFVLTLSAFIFVGWYSYKQVMDISKQNKNLLKAKEQIGVLRF